MPRTTIAGWHHPCRLCAWAQPVGTPPNAGKFGRLANPGGPPHSAGAFLGEVVVGMQTTDDYVFVTLTPEGLRTDIGNNTSWECAPGMGPGAYRAIVTEHNIFPDGTEETNELCWFGNVDFQAKTIAWDVSTDECPTKVLCQPAELLPSMMSPPSTREAKPPPAARNAHLGRLAERHESALYRCPFLELSCTASMASSLS